MLVTFGFFAPTELIIVLVIALIIFGPGKLPDVGKAMGKSIKEFKEATNGDGKEESKKEVSIAKDSE